MNSRKIEFEIGLPEDVIQIKQFKGRKFQFLFYSPSERSLYQIPVPKIKKLNENAEGYIIPRTSDGKQLKLTIDGIERQLDDFRAISDNFKTESNTNEGMPFIHSGCYLIQLYCDKGTNKYKIGMSRNLLKRLKSTEYRNASIILVCRVDRCLDCEREIIEQFSKCFTRIKESEEGSYGNEVFEGDINEMSKLFVNICTTFQPNTTPSSTII